jgi:hypothetical protein
VIRLFILNRMFPGFRLSEIGEIIRLPRTDRMLITSRATTSAVLMTIKRVFLRVSAKVAVAVLNVP